MAKREPLKIAASFKDAVKALLATPPPPDGYTASTRKRKAKQVAGKGKKG